MLSGLAKSEKNGDACLTPLWADIPLNLSHFSSWLRICKSGFHDFFFFFLWKQFSNYPWSWEKISWPLMPLGKPSHFSPAHPSFMTPALSWASLGLGSQSSVRELYFCLLSLKTPGPGSICMCCDLGKTRVFEFNKRLKLYFVCCFIRRIFFFWGTDKGNPACFPQHPEVNAFSGLSSGSY